MLTIGSKGCHLGLVGSLGASLYESACGHKADRNATVQCIPLVRGVAGSIYKERSSHLVALGLNGQDLKATIRANHLKTTNLLHWIYTTKQKKNAAKRRKPHGSANADKNRWVGEMPTQLLVRPMVEATRPGLLTSVASPSTSQPRPQLPLPQLTQAGTVAEALPLPHLLN